MNTRTLRKVILAAFAVIVALIVASNVNFGSFGSGGSDRSVGNYCDTWLNYTKPKGEEYNSTVAAYKKAMASGTQEEQTKTSQDLATMFAAMPGDLAELYDTVDKVAPSDIEPDVARAAQDAHAFEDQNRHVPTSLAGFGGGFLEKLLLSMGSSGTQQRIHNWNAAHCTNLQGKNDYFN